MKKSMNPYDIDIESLRESKPITDSREILKLQLSGIFVKETRYLSTKEIISKTKLDKSDLSRIYVMDVKRFSIEKFISLLSAIGYCAEFKVKKKK